VAQNSDNLDSIPSFEAPPGGQLTNDMVAAFEASGVIKVENFVALEDCGRLRKRAHELVEAFNPETVRSTSTTRATRFVFSSKITHLMTPAICGSRNTRASTR
jgi:hypothetical protein